MRRSAINIRLLPESGSDFGKASIGIRHSEIANHLVQLPGKLFDLVRNLRDRQDRNGFIACGNY